MGKTLTVPRRRRLSSVALAFKSLAPRRVGGNEADFGRESSHRVEKGCLVLSRLVLTPTRRTSKSFAVTISPRPDGARFHIPNEGLRVRDATPFGPRPLSGPLARRVNHVASHRSARLDRRRVLALLSAGISTVPGCIERAARIGSLAPAGPRVELPDGSETPADADTAISVRSRPPDTDRRATTGYLRDLDERGRCASSLHCWWLRRRVPDSVFAPRRKDRGK